MTFSDPQRNCIRVDDTAATAAIPAPSRQESAELMELELARFTELLERFAPDDWTKPTGCAHWNVKDITAHKAGSLAAYASWSEFWRQMSPLAQRPYRMRGMSSLDAMNQIQVDDRAARTPAELITEIHTVGARAIRTWRSLPLPLRMVPLPAPPPKGGLISIAYLADVIYLRDAWMHRLDLALATGRAFVQTREHDGRIVALVIRDLAQTLPRHLDGASAVYELTGVAGGKWRIGPSVEAAATIRMDVLDFAQLSSERIRAADVMSRTEILGDAALARRALDHTAVLY